MKAGLSPDNLSSIREPVYFPRLRASWTPHSSAASVEVITVTQWLSRCLLNGTRIIVPAIVYYELKRELLRAKKTFSIGRLDAFINAAPGRYLPLSDDALRLAAELWAQSRQAGGPTAESKALA